MTYVQDCENYLNLRPQKKAAVSSRRVEVLFFYGFLYESLKLNRLLLGSVVFTLGRVTVFGLLFYEDCNQAPVAYNRYKQTQFFVLRFL